MVAAAVLLKTSVVVLAMLFLVLATQSVMY
jgi:hypothetical protein